MGILPAVSLALLDPGEDDSHKWLLGGRAGFHFEISISHLGRLYLSTSFLGPEVAKERKVHHFIHRLTRSLFFQPRLCSHCHYVECISTGHDWSVSTAVFKEGSF